MKGRLVTRGFWAACLALGAAVFVTFVAPFAGAEPATLSATPAPPAELTIATWNVANYLALGRRVEGTYRPDYPKPEREKAALRAALHAMNADVVALQEMGPPPYLAELQRDLRSEGLDYPHTAHVEGADDARHLALLSREPLLATQAHTELTFKQGATTGRVRRGLLEVRVAVAGGELTLFVVHLKSRLTEEAADPGGALQRAGEAVAVRDFILGRFPDPAASSSRFLLVGDCNDTPDSRPLRALQRRGRTEILRMLPAADARGDGWTHAYAREGRYERVDYVLVSPALVAGVLEQRTQVWDDDHVRLASDHRPLVVRLRWPAPNVLPAAEAAASPGP